MEELSRLVSLSLIIPCYNEADRIERLYKGVADFLAVWKGPLDIIIVNDGSSDNTYRLLQDHITYKDNSELITILTQGNTGKGGALKYGVSIARGEYILTLDADMASPPTEIIGWLKRLGGKPDINTVYIGSREHKDSIIKKTGNRKLAGNIFNSLVRLLTPLSQNDTQCGFKLYHASFGKQLFADLTTYGWAHDVELLYYAKLMGKRIVEMPLEWNAIEGSKIRLIRDSIKMIAEILQITIRTKKRYKKSK